MSRYSPTDHHLVDIPLRTLPAEGRDSSPLAQSGRSQLDLPLRAPRFPLRALFRSPYRAPFFGLLRGSWMQRCNLLISTSFACLPVLFQLPSKQPSCFDLDTNNLRIFGPEVNRFRLPADGSCQAVVRPMPSILVSVAWAGLLAAFLVSLGQRPAPHWLWRAKNTCTDGIIWGTWSLRHGTPPTAILAVGFPKRNICLRLITTLTSCTQDRSSVCPEPPELLHSLSVVRA